MANASHYDNKDGSLTISTCVEDTLGNTQNWYLLFPNLKCHMTNSPENMTNDNYTSSVVTNNQNRATAIQLFHGCTVNWDVSRLRHASSQVSYRDNRNCTSGGNCQVRKRCSIAALSWNKFKT